MSFADYPTLALRSRAQRQCRRCLPDHRNLAQEENAAERFLHERRALPSALRARAGRRAPYFCRAAAPARSPARRPAARRPESFSNFAVLPDAYPLVDDVGSYLSDELGFGRLLDYGLIVPRFKQLYEWSAHELAAPGRTSLATAHRPTPGDLKRPGCLAALVGHDPTGPPSCRTALRPFRDEMHHALLACLATRSSMK